MFEHGFLIHDPRNPHDYRFLRALQSFIRKWPDHLCSHAEAVYDLLETLRADTTEANASTLATRCETALTDCPQSYANPFEAARRLALSFLSPQEQIR